MADPEAEAAELLAPAIDRLRRRDAGVAVRMGQDVGCSRVQHPTERDDHAHSAVDVVATEAISMVMRWRPLVRWVRGGRRSCAGGPSR